MGGPPHVGQDPIPGHGQPPPPPGEYGCTATCQLGSKPGTWAAPPPAKKSDSCCWLSSRGVSQVGSWTVGLLPVARLELVEVGIKFVPPGGA